MLKLKERHIEFLRSLWTNSRLDLRQTRNGRWYDQKVTPDIMSAICAVISGENWKERRFTRKDVEKSPEFRQQMTDFFGKPTPGHPGSSSEYDKVASQPLNVLTAAGILEKVTDKGRKCFFIASPDAQELISEVAESEMVAYEFLRLYIAETLKQSGLNDLFDTFFEKEDKASFAKLKRGYAKFIIRYTPINGEAECARIFTKVINILAFSRKKKGTHRGRLSSVRVNLSDIRYNRTNWRDDAVRKPKETPRQIWEIHPSHPISGMIVHNAGLRVRKTVQDVKQFHNSRSEILDSHSGKDAPGAVSVQGHHIFPKSQYPNLAYIRENIILLTPTQHVSEAHGGDGVYGIDDSYQGFCLIEKLGTVMKCETDPNCNFYSLEGFKAMLVQAGVLCAVKTYNEADIKRAIWAFYKAK